MAFNPELGGKREKVPNDRRALAANDPHYRTEVSRELGDLTDNELFGRRKAHELMRRSLRFRDAAIDVRVIEDIQTIMEERGLTEANYENFLKKSPESD